MKKKITKIYLLLAAILCFPSFIFAANDLPTMMVGQTMVDYNGRTFWGGMNGNYAIYNSDADSSYGFHIGSLTNTCLSPANPVCFVLGTGLTGGGNAGANKLMTSRTLVFINGAQTPIYELPALYLGGVNVIGDAYGSNDYLSNFAFWGRNLAQSSGDISSDTGATWSVDNYSLNSSAQAVWTSLESQSFIAKMKNLESEAQSVSDLSGNNWYLQGQNLTTDVGSLDKDKYPNGKAWKYTGNLTLSGTKTLDGNGTLIVRGNLTISSNASITKTAGSTFGIIVFGNVTLAGNNSIEAPIVAASTDGTNGNITIGDNTSLSGSYVAISFPGLSSRHNVNIAYDYNLDNAWPPGFRYLKMPTPVEIGNR